MCHRRFWSRCISGAKFAVLAGVVGALVFLIAPGRETQEPIFKIGFVDMTRLFNEYDQTKLMQNQFEAELHKEEEALNKKKQPLEQLEKEIEEKTDTVPENELRDLRDRYNEELRSLVEYRDRRLRVLRNRQQEQEKKLLDELQQAVKDYGTRQGYSMILRKSMLLFGAQSYDLTDAIIEAVNN